MYQNLFITYIKKALLVLTAMAFGLGLTLLPSDSHALVDSPEPYLFKDINPGPESSGIQELTNVNGTLFFAADDGVHGWELWKSDGTAAGTVMVKDIYPGSANSSPLYLTDVNGTLFFSADDDVHGYELWKSDGTAAGTVMVKDINPGGGWSIPHKKWLDVEDFSMPHGNGCTPEPLKMKIEAIREEPEYINRPRPILINEDSVFVENLDAAVSEYASWGFYCQGYGSDYKDLTDWKKPRETEFENLSGFQTIPVNWSINTKRKKQFFDKVYEITQGI